MTATTDTSFVRISIIFVAIVSAAMPALGAKDQANPTTANGSDETWYVDVDDENKVKKWTYDTFEATEEADNPLSHQLNRDGEFIPHIHKLEEWGDANKPTVADGNTYWDARFVHNGVTRVSGTNATVKHQTCHEYALTTSAAGGTYTYRIHPDNISDTYFDDCDFVSTIDAGNILVYAGVPEHASYVVTVDGSPSLPSKLRWKWLTSGIYKLEPEANHEKSTPMCKGGVTSGQPLEDQNWTWDDDYASSPSSAKPK